MDDRELMQRWKRGDRTAFDALVQRWQQPLARFLARVSGEAASVPDLCQEVFLKLYHAKARYQERGTFASWFYRIALNVARDALRKRARSPVLPLSHEPLCPRRNGEANSQHRELTERVQDSLAQLPDLLRLIIAWRLDAGRSFEEIARSTGVAASTWKSRYFKAMQLLRERLTRQGYDTEESLP